MKTPRFLALLLVLLAPLAAAESVAPLSTEARQAWDNSSRLFSAEALAGFSKLTAQKDTATRENRFGYALSLLSVQPVTAEHMEESRKIMADLAQTEDDVGLGANYFVARIVQNYREKPDYADAAARYRALIARHAASYWGQEALCKLTVLVLYVLPAQNAAARVAEVEKLLPLCGPVSQRNLHMMIADASLYYSLPEPAALRHLVAAYEVKTKSTLPDNIQADLTAQIIVVSARTHQLEQAHVYAARFKQAYPRDWRNYAIGKIIEAADAGRPLPVEGQGAR